jgi:mycofactocin system creatininase family protein
MPAHDIAETVLLPLGATEQHGPHLPLATDTLIAGAVAERAARLLGRTAVALPIPVGASSEHRDFPGTISLPHEVLAALVAQLCHDLRRRGFRRIAVFSAHGGNGRALALAAGRLGDDVVILPDFQLAPVLAGLGIDGSRAGVHAGLAETSAVLAIDARLVRMDQAEPGYVGALEDIWGVLTTAGLRPVTANGVLGDPRGASRALGELCLDAWAAAIVEAVARRRNGAG